MRVKLILTLMLFCLTCPAFSITIDNKNPALPDTDTDSWLLSLEVDESQDRTAFDQAIAQLGQGNIAGAREQLKAIRSAAPNTVGRWELEGLIQLMEGDAVAAEQSLRKAIDINPSIASVWAKLGSALITQQKWDDGSSAHLRAVELDPGNVLSHNVLARLATAQGDYPLAEAHYRTAIASMEPGYTNLHRELTLLLLKTDQPQSALDLLAPIAQSAPEPEAMLLLAQAQRYAGDIDAARKTALEVTTLYENDVTAWTSSANLLIELGAIDQAVATLVTATKKFPSQAILKFQLGNAYQQQGKQAEAERIYRDLIDGSQLRVAALNNLAFMLAGSQDRKAEALPLARQADSEVPDSPPIQDTLGWVLYRNGQAAEGLRYLRKASSRTTNDADLICRVAIVTADVEGVGPARADLERCVESQADAVLVRDATAQLGST